MLEKVVLAEKLALFEDHWDPRIVGEVGGTHIKLAKVQGTFVWHDHRDEDELFLVLRGSLVIELRDGSVTLEPGEFLVVPKGVEHRPVAEEEVHPMLIEPASIRRTGDVVDNRTVEVHERT